MNPAERHTAKLHAALAELLALPTPDTSTLFPNSCRLQPAVNNGSTTEEAP